MRTCAGVSATSAYIHHRFIADSSSIHRPVFSWSGVKIFVPNRAGT